MRGISPEQKDYGNKNKSIYRLEAIPALDSDEDESEGDQGIIKSNFLFYIPQVTSFLVLKYYIVLVIH